jgi:integrase/recombinase XerD
MYMMNGVKEYTNLFKKSLESKGKTKSTVLAYTTDIDQFLKFVLSEVDDIKKIDESNVKNFINNLQKTKYTAKSISRKLNSIRTFFKFLNSEGIVSINPADKVQHPKIKSKDPRILTETEYMALRDACRYDQRMSTIVELLLQTGIRIGELCRLSLDNLKMRKNKPISMVIDAYESNPSREVPLNAIASKAIEDYLKIRPRSDDNSLFVTKTGKPLLVRNVRFYITRAFKKANIKNATVNDLRNTFIAHHLNRGTNLIAISQIVGHRRISTTERYIAKAKESKLKVVQPTLSEL